MEDNQKALSATLREARVFLVNQVKRDPITPVTRVGRAKQIRIASGLQTQNAEGVIMVSRLGPIRY